MTAGTFTDLDGRAVTRKKTKVTWDASAAEKRAIPISCWKEIHEQPQTILDLEGTLLLRERRGGFAGYRSDAETVRRRGAHLDRGVRHQLACGFWSKKYLLEEMVRTPAGRYRQRIRYRDPLIEKNDLFITISQSGKPLTPWLRPEAKQKGVRASSIVNVVAVPADGRRCTRTVALKSASRRRRRLPVSWRRSTCWPLHLGRVRGVLSVADGKAWLDRLVTVPVPVKHVLGRGGDFAMPSGTIKTGLPVSGAAASTFPIARRRAEAERNFLYPCGRDTRPGK